MMLTGSTKYCNIYEKADRDQPLSCKVSRHSIIASLCSLYYSSPGGALALLSGLLSSPC